MALTSFVYETELDAGVLSLRWHVTARELLEHWHPQPYFDVVTVHDGELTWEEGEAVATLPPTFLLGPGVRPAIIRSTTPVALSGVRLPLTWPVLALERSAATPAPVEPGIVARPADLPSTRATISARHARRLHRARFGVSAQRLAAIVAVQEFVDAGCPDSPRDSLLIHSVNVEKFYDQAHFSRTFRSVVGVPPSRFVDRDSAWVEALMAISSKRRDHLPRYGDNGKESP